MFSFMLCMHVFIPRVYFFFFRTPSLSIWFSTCFFLWCISSMLKLPFLVSHTTGLSEDPRPFGTQAFSGCAWCCLKQGHCEEEVDEEEYEEEEEWLASGSKRETDTEGA